MRAVLFWSGGKDCAIALRELAREHEVVALLTTYDAPSNTLPFHGVELGLIAAQAAQLGLPLLSVPLPPNCPNSYYEQATGESLGRAKSQLGAEAVAFGDLHLADVRQWREEFAQRQELEPLFPLWGRDTAELARQIVADHSLGAVVCCVDSRKLPSDWLGRAYDQRFLDELPDDIDPCGENGEFHTFVFRMDGWSGEIAFRSTQTILSGRYPALRLTGM